MKCDACTAEIPDGSAFCNRCGAAIDSRSAPTSAPGPRVPAELLREREKRAEVALELERVRLRAEREQVRGRRAFMIGVFVLALLGSTMVTMLLNRRRGRAAPPQPPEKAAAPRAPAPTEPGGLRLENIHLARGRDREGQPQEPLSVLTLGIDRDVFCFFDIVGGSGEVALSVQWWRLGSVEHRTQVTVNLDAPMTPRSIPLRVPDLGEPGAWEIRFVCDREQTGVLRIRVQQAVAARSMAA